MAEQDDKKAYQAAWRKANAEHIKAYQAAWRKANAEHIKAYQAAYEHANKAKRSSWRHRNRQKMNESQSKYSKTAAGRHATRSRRLKGRAYLNQIKSKSGCSNPNCKFPNLVPDSCLEFHHVDPTTKLFNLGASSSRSLKSLREEAAKCVVLCVVCHRLYTHEKLDIEKLERCVV